MHILPDSERVKAMKEKKKSIAGILSMITILVISAGCLFGCGKSDGDKESGGYEAVVKEYFEAVKKGDAEKYLSLYPEKLIDKEVEEGYGGDKEELIELADDELDTVLDALEDSGIRISKLKYTIVDAVNMDRDELENLNGEFEKYEIDLKTEEAIDISIEVTVPDRGQKEKVIMKMRLVKAEGIWSLFEDDFYALRKLLPSYVEDDHGYEEPENN